MILLLPFSVWGTEVGPGNHHRHREKPGDFISTHKIIVQEKNK